MAICSLEGFLQIDLGGGAAGGQQNQEKNKSDWRFNILFEGGFFFIVSPAWWFQNCVPSKQQDPGSMSTASVQAALLGKAAS